MSGQGGDRFGPLKQFEYNSVHFYLYENVPDTKRRALSDENRTNDFVLLTTCAKHSVYSGSPDMDSQDWWRRSAAFTKNYNNITVQEAFTGLEASLVLIAFVVVAAVFSYVVLSAGFTSSAQGLETIYESVGMASTVITISGDVYGIDNGVLSGGYVNNIIIPVSLNPSGKPVDFSNVNIRCLSPKHNQELIKCDPLINSDPPWRFWSICEIANGNDDTVLEDGELFMLNLYPMYSIPVYQKFTVEIKVPGYSPTRIEKTVPPEIKSHCVVIL
ncbi:MAG: flagellin [Methanogenium sp.]|nr:flagellin [Methanogenium sp.]